MSWTHDVCLSCGENETRDGAKFCSQACRLADLERATGYSQPPTPAAVTRTTPSWNSWQMSSSSASASRQHAFQLSPAYNFDNYRQQAPIESPPSSPRSRSVHQSYFSSQSATSASTSQPTGRGLTLSPSRSSLSSVSSSGTSSQSSPGLSEETINQLRNYSGAFDQTRTWKRRTTYS